MSVKQNLVLLSLAAALLLRRAGFRAEQPAERRTAQRMDLLQSDAPSVSESLTLTVNKSYMIEFSADIDDIIIANPAIANVTARDRRRRRDGRWPGESNIVFLDRSGAADEGAGNLGDGWHRRAWTSCAASSNATSPARRSRSNRSTARSSSPARRRTCRR